MALLQIAEPGMSATPHQKRLAVGIDLGTTHSLVAVVRNGACDVLADERGRVLLPSVVHYAKEGVGVGYGALEAALEDPGNTVQSVKRLMGKTAAEVSASYAASHRLAADSRLAVLETDFGRKTPVEVSSEILRALRTRAEETLGEEIMGAVITVPAYFDDAQRQATKDAARLAGIHVLRLLNEPTAAALAYGLDKGAEGLYVVYDLGGGTFDVSVLELKKGVFEVRATGGDSALGGDDYDAALSRQMKAAAGIAECDAATERLFRRQARAVKEALTRSETASYRFEACSKTVSGSVSKEGFEALTQELTRKTLDIFKSVLADARLAVSDVKGVVLVGGSTRMPVIRREVERLFGRPPYTSIDPDTVVAAGAAHEADLLSGNRSGSDWVLLDVTPLSLGIETMGGLVEKIIPRNSPIPVARAQDFTTFKDGQRALAVHVLQGERELVDACRSLARFELRGIPPLVAGSARIRVTFTVDADGLLSVSAKELKSGVEAHVAVKPSYGLTEEEIARMIGEGNANAERDMAERALREKVLEAERLVVSTRSALAEDAELLSPEERAELVGLADRLSRTVQDRNSGEIDAAFAALSKATETFAARRMDRAIEKALAGKSIEEIR